MTAGDLMLSARQVNRANALLLRTDRCLRRAPGNVDCARHVRRHPCGALVGTHRAHKRRKGLEIAPGLDDKAAAGRPHARQLAGGGKGRKCGKRFLEVQCLQNFERAVLGVTAPLLRDHPRAFLDNRTI